MRLSPVRPGLVRSLAPPLTAVVLAACGSAARTSTVREPDFCRDSQPLAACVVADRGRFTVAIGPSLISPTTTAGVSLTATVTRDLTRIGRLLPGPAADIRLDAGAQVIPGTGVMGYTRASGLVTATLDTHESPTALRRTLRAWLLVALSHEVDHSVRILAGPGFGTSLLDQIVSEGVASAFDIEVQPNIDLPWTHALTARQEQEMWHRARPQLNLAGLYDQWFFGGNGVPHWAAFQIGYHIARDYLARHPRSTAASIVNTPAAVILAGSHYRG